MKAENVALQVIEAGDNNIDERLAAIGLERMSVASVGSDGKVGLKNILSPTPSTKQYKRLVGPSLVPDDYVFVANVLGTKVVLGKIMDDISDDVVFGGQVVAPSFNSPYFEAPAISMTPVVASHTSTSVYEVNVENASFDLPEGVWTVYAVAGGMFSHSVNGGTVRVRLYIGTDQGTSLQQPCALNPTRTQFTIANNATGLSGSLNVSLKYQPVTAGTAFAGGGWVWAQAIRTA